MAFADAGDVRIHYTDHGGDGTPLVAVHATGFHGGVWEPFLETWSDRFRVVTLDQRGHGDSDKPRSGYDWRRFGEDVLAVVDDAGLDAPAGIGHSAGAAALVFAESLRPGTFSRLVLMDPVTPPPEVRGMMTEGNPLAEGARRRRTVWPSPEEMAERLGTGTPLAAWREPFRLAYARGGLRRAGDGWQLKCPPDVEAQIYENGGRHDGYERMQRLGCPVLMLIGEHSELWGHRYGLPELPNGRVEIVVGGHFFPMEEPEATMDVVLPFLDGR